MEQLLLLISSLFVLSNTQTYPILHCGESVVGTLGVSSTSADYYRVTLNTSTTFYGVFDTCNQGTNFDTKLYIYNLTGYQLRYLDDSASCSINHYYTIMSYNMTSYPNNGISNGQGTFLFAVDRVGSNYGQYEISLQCGDPTPAPTPIPTLRPTLPPFSTDALTHYIGVSETKNWSEAMAYCSSVYNAPLAIIHSEEQNKKVAYQCYQTSGQYCWIGMRYYQTANNESWQWVDHSSKDYDKWSSGSNDGSYATLYYYNGYWTGQEETSYYGANKYPFVCGTPSDNADSDSSNDTALGLGLGFGLGIPVVIIMCVVVYCFFFRKSKNAAPDFLELPENEPGDTPKEEGPKEEGPKEEGPKDGMGYMEGCMASPHLKSWILTLTIWILIFIKIACVASPESYCSCTYCSSSYSTGNYWDDDTDTDSDCDFDSCDKDYLSCSSPCAFGYAPGGWWIGLFVFTLCLYLVEVWLSSSRRYLSQSFVKETVYEYINRVKSNAPVLWWKVECYHYETRTRLVTYTDSNGNQQVRTETYQEKVVTHTAADNYRYNSWSDVSQELQGLHEYKLTKITFYKDFCFANNETENDYNTRMQEFKRINNRDVYQDFWSGMDLDGYTSKMLAEVSPGVRPAALKLEWFILASLCLFTPCYRMWFASIVGNKKYHTFMKSVNIY